MVSHQLVSVVVVAHVTVAVLSTVHRGIVVVVKVEELSQLVPARPTAVILREPHEQRHILDRSRHSCLSYAEPFYIFMASSFSYRALQRA